MSLQKQHFVLSNLIKDLQCCSGLEPMTFCTVVWFLALSFTAKQFQTMVVWQGNELLYAEPSIKSDGVEILILKFNLVLCFFKHFWQYHGKLCKH